ncbi:hypothetical protein C9422_10980 [Pseudomonas sp. B1(2018)]|nr:hypothetical protein C9422_10980 [Pseudomonas sp. B1(2018)]
MARIASIFYLAPGFAFCRSCRRLRSFDLEKPNQKIAAFGSSYTGNQAVVAGLSTCSSIHFTKSRTLGTSAECSGYAR